MANSENDSRTCVVCVLILIPVLGGILFLTDIFPGVNFSEDGWTAIPKVIGYLGVLALLIERLIEIILSPCRERESRALKEALQTARAGAATAPDQMAAAAEVKSNETALAEYKSITHRWALFIGFAAALATACAGVRLIGPLLDTTALVAPAKAYRSAELEVTRVKQEEKRRRDAYHTAWDSARASLTGTNLSLVHSNRVYEQSGESMARFSTNLSPVGALSNAALAKMAWEAASTNTALAVAARDTLLEQESSHRQLWWLRLIDVLLTAAALTGGTQPLHELLAWWSQANEKRKKNP